MSQNRLDETALRERFEEPTLNPKQIADARAIRTASADLASLIVKLCPTTRETSLAITNIEQAMMWSIAALQRK